MYYRVLFKEVETYSVVAFNATVRVKIDILDIHFAVIVIDPSFKPRLYRPPNHMTCLSNHAHSFIMLANFLIFCIEVPLKPTSPFSACVIISILENTQFEAVGRDLNSILQSILSHANAASSRSRTISGVN